jgi:Cu-Zn family superoxide dismutase
MMPCMPMAVSHIKGSDQYPGIEGMVRFYDVPGGTQVCAQVWGLPADSPADAAPMVGPFFAFHLHAGAKCTPVSGSDAFADTDGHYNPTDQPHPRHAGDFPVLLANNGYAEMCFFTDRFKPWEAVGHTTVIHLLPDDYRTQPAGAAGTKIACGMVQPLM